MRHRPTFHMKSIELRFAIWNPKKQIERQSPNQTRTYCDSDTVSGYGPYLEFQRSKNCKISFVGNKI